MHRAFKWVLPLAAIGLVSSVILGRAFLSRHGASGNALTERELATRTLGQYLAQHYPGKQALILSNPFTRQKGRTKQIYQFEEAGLAGLREGFGRSLAIEAVVFPEVRPEFHQNPAAAYVDPKTTTPLSYLMAVNALDSLWRQHRRAELIVSLIGLPINLRQTEAWRNPQGPKFALLLPDLRMVGDQKSIRDAIQSGKIAAVILKRPDGPAEGSSLGRDVKKEFANRFLLVTAESVDTALQRYPRLF